MKSNTYSIVRRAYARARRCHRAATPTCGERSRKRGERIVNIALAGSGKNRSNSPASRTREISLSYRGPTCPVRRMPALTPVQRKDVHTPPRSSRRTPCAPSRDHRASVYTSYTSLPDTHGRQTREGQKVPPLPALRTAAPSPARVARASTLPILHSPTPTGARRTKGGKCCHSPPRTARALSRESRASVYTSYTSLPDAHRRQTHQGREVLPLPAPVTSCRTRCRAKA
jgi:hypothetical protein